MQGGESDRALDIWIQCLPECVGCLGASVPLIVLSFLEKADK